MRIAMVLCVLLVGLPLFAAAASAAPSAWHQINSDGFGDATNRATYCMLDYDGLLYVGTYNTARGTEVWQLHSDDETWSQSNSDGFGDANNTYSDCMAVFHDKLYVGTCNFATGGQVWAFDGRRWAQANASGFGTANNLVVFSLAVYRDRLYAGTMNGSGCEVWVYDGAAWSPSATGGFGDRNNSYCYCMAVSGGKLYAGTMNYSTGAEVWAFDGSNWAQANPDGFGDPANLAHSMADYHGNLYVGTYNSAGAEVWAYDGTDWSQVNQNGFGSAANVTVRSMTLFEDRLYMGTQNDTTGGGVWSYDGADWTMENTPGFGDPNNRRCYGLAGHADRIYAGTYNGINGVEIWRNELSRPTLNLASSPAGDVKVGDEITYTLRAGNSGDVMATACLLADAIPDRTEYVPGSTTLNGLAVPDIGGSFPLAAGLAVNAPGRPVGNIGGGEQAVVTFRVRVKSGLPEIRFIRNTCVLHAAGRPEVTKSVDNPLWESSLPSTPELPSTWYFAEGTTQPGFDEYILLSNMSESALSATITYLTQDGREKQVSHDLPAHSRRTVYVNAEMPGEVGLAAIVRGTAGFVCERALYFSLGGVDGCHQVIGSDAPAKDLFFAEGFTGRPDDPFREWILVLNPGTEPAHLHVDFLFDGDAGEQRDYVVAARSRCSIDVNGEVGGNREVSTQLQSDQPLVAERAMYFDYQNVWAGGHVGKAATAARNDWYLAEGFTGYSWSPFDEYILVSNSNDSDNPVQLIFMYPDGTTKEFCFTAKARGRLTILADEWVGEGQMISARVHADRPVVVERAMYFDFLLRNRGGSNCLAAGSPKSTLYFAEGYTGDSDAPFEVYLLIQNTAAEAKTALVEYFLGSGEVITREVTLPAASRTTVRVNDVLVSPTVEFSMRVSTKDGSASLLAERATYSDYSGPCGHSGGGDAVVGY